MNNSLTSLTKRGAVYHFDQVIGGNRLRFSLGTRDQKTASRLANRVSFAIGDGPKSPVWGELRCALPVSSYKRLTGGILPPEPIDLQQFEQRFYNLLGRREELGEIASSTRHNYERTIRVFFDRMLELGHKRVTDLTTEAVEEYLLWRKESITTKGGSGRGVLIETTVLSLLLDYAVEEGWLPKTPLKHKPKMPEPEERVHPFTPEEVRKMDAVEKTPIGALLYAVFKYTGLRCSDVCDLRWTAIDWSNLMLHWRTAKRGRMVDIPLNRELYRMLKDAHIPEDKGRIFPDANTTRLYKHIRRIGEQAGVENCHPHRFRHTFACRLLAKGASLFDVAKLLGDTHAVVDKHYGKWTSGQADRVRELLESSIQEPAGVV